MPSLVTTSNPVPIIGNGFPTTETVFGDEVDGGLSVGYRLDVGRYFGDNIGLGGRFWMLFGE